MRASKSLHAHVHTHTAFFLRLQAFGWVFVLLFLLGVS